MKKKLSIFSTKVYRVRIEMASTRSASFTQVSKLVDVKAMQSGYVGLLKSIDFASDVHHFFAAFFQLHKLYSIIEL